MKLLLASVIALGLALGGTATACPDKDKSEKQTADTSISVDDAAEAKQKGEVVMVDANSDKTRKKLGVVPGAVLLTSYKDFDVKELNAKKSDTLVFYCHSESCGAAPAAAKIAKKKGFKVKVMHAGIVGWKKAGHAVKKI
jgi:rhodanese-related sulfurtransferase